MSQMEGAETSDRAELATLTDRLLGQILDSFVAIAAIAFSLLPYAVSEPVGQVTSACGLGIAVFYILFADGFSNGQSYGKRLMKTAVVDEDDGTPCTFFQSFLRNLLLAILGPIDWLFIFGQKRQRLGDKAASTIVISVSN